MRIYQYQVITKVPQGASNTRGKSLVEPASQGPVFFFEIHVKASHIAHRERISRSVPKHLGDRFVRMLDKRRLEACSDEIEDRFSYHMHRGRSAGPR